MFSTQHTQQQHTQYTNDTTNILDPFNGSQANFTDNNKNLHNNNFLPIMFTEVDSDGLYIDSGDVMRMNWQPIKQKQKSYKRNEHDLNQSIPKSSFFDVTPIVEPIVITNPFNPFNNTICNNNESGVKKFLSFD
jgi:hypothetical protein